MAVRLAAAAGACASARDPELARPRAEAKAATISGADIGRRNGMVMVSGLESCGIGPVSDGTGHERLHLQVTARTLASPLGFLGRSSLNDCLHLRVNAEWIKAALMDLDATRQLVGDGVPWVKRK